MAGPAGDGGFAGVDGLDDAMFGTINGLAAGLVCGSGDSEFGEYSTGDAAESSNGTGKNSNIGDDGGGAV